ncbi:MAG: ChbG/HpnK family deacetylase [Candidatus Omnitrophota bacterium]
MPKKLIITADDYGLSEDANKAIMECCLRGAVTDISLLAEGEAFEHAVRLARENGVAKIGVHLSVSEDYKAFFLKYFTGLLSVNELYREFKKQISRVKNAGFRVTRLDSHQHIHMIPGIFRIVVKLIKEEGIEYVRFPLEKLSLPAKLSDPIGWLRNVLLSSACRMSQGILTASGVKCSDYFIGHARALRLKREDFFSAVSNLEDGLTELGCHPGQHKEELDVLCDRGFIDEIKKRSIELISY